MRNRLKNKGFMMIEVIIVASIIIVSVLAAMSVTQKAISVSRQSLHILQSSFLLEELIVHKNDTLNNILDTTYPTLIMCRTSLPNDILRTVNIANVERDAITQDITSSGVVDAGTKLVTVTVSWLEGSVVVNKSLSFYIMNIF
jgi:type II secretory pathway pseudopilin PulG